MKNLQLPFGTLIIINGIVFIYSCSKDAVTHNVADSKVELRSSGCDGAPMAAPKILPTPFILDGACCFTLQFSPVYIPESPYQVVGLDSLGNSLATKPNGFCTGELSNPGYTLECCITDIASSITISLNPGGPNATCVEIDLPCSEL
jgi:hypothetical protein